MLLGPVHQGVPAAVHPGLEGLGTQGLAGPHLGRQRSGRAALDHHAEQPGHIQGVSEVDQVKQLLGQGHGGRV
eukprot:13243813-Heterocapsa_arctica.AAC.1